MGPLTLDCPACGPVRPAVAWKPWASGLGRHLEATCPTCRRYLKYLPQTPENVALVPPAPPPSPGLFDALE